MEPGAENIHELINNLTNPKTISCSYCLGPSTDKRRSKTDFGLYWQHILILHSKIIRVMQWKNLIEILESLNFVDIQLILKLDELGNHKITSTDVPAQGNFYFG